MIFPANHGQELSGPGVGDNNHTDKISRNSDLQVLQKREGGGLGTLCGLAAFQIAELQKAVSARMHLYRNQTTHLLGVINPLTTFTSAKLRLFDVWDKMNKRRQMVICLKMDIWLMCRKEAIERGDIESIRREDCRCRWAIREMFLQPLQL